MSKKPGRAYEFWNIFVVICETNILYQLTKSLTKWNPWLCSFLVSNTLLSRKSRYEPQALGYRINWEMHTQYAGAAGIVLQINGKLTIKLKSSDFFSSSCVLNQSSLSTSRCSLVWNNCLNTTHFKANQKSLKKNNGRSHSKGKGMHYH